MAPKKTKPKVRVRKSGRVEPKYFFSFSPIFGFKLHATEGAAMDAAQFALERYRDGMPGLGGGWDLAVQDVCWGRLVEQVVLVPQTHYLVDTPSGPQHPAEACLVEIGES